MRLAGEDNFCCPAHKKLYHEEHSRIGLARLLEEVSAGAGQAEATQKKTAVLEAVPEENSNGQPVGESAPAEGTETTAPQEEQEAAVELRRFPSFEFSPKPMFGSLTRLEFDTVDYVAGPAEAQETAVPGKVRSPEASASSEEFRGVLPPPVPTAKQESSAAATETETAVATLVAEPPGTSATAVSEPEVQSPKQAAEVKAVPSKPVAAPAVKKLERRREKETQTKEEPEPETAPTNEMEFHFGGTEVDPAATKETSPRTLKFLAAGVLGVLLAVGGYFALYHGGPTTQAAVEQSSAIIPLHWAEGWPTDSGTNQVALFEPSAEWTDYRIETKTNRYTGLGFMFRAADSGNYYTVKLVADRNDSIMNVFWAAVVDGAPVKEVKKFFPVPKISKDIISVQLEVRGSMFRLYVDGTLASSWIDDRLQKGGVGILGKHVNLSKAEENVRVTQLDGASADLPGDAGGSARLQDPGTGTTTSPVRNVSYPGQAEREWRESD